MDFEEGFSAAREKLQAQVSTAIVIDLHSTTFQIVGALTHQPTDLLISICQQVLSSLSMFSFSDYQAAFRNSTFSDAEVNSRQSQLVEKACNYMLQNLDRHLTLVSISRALYTNRNTLSNAFKNEVGQGVATWLRQQRMTKAMELLRNTDKSIQEIAISVGYPDQANFSTAFKNTFDEKPLQMRRHKKE